jgi:uncharacterized membrane protein SpoIIM required for sporulation
MNLERFTERGQPTWARLDRALTAAKGRPERLGPGGVRELGKLYRVAAADLAIARRRWPGDPLTIRLEELVSRARPLVYDSEGKREGVWSFFATTYWRRVAERPVFLLLAMLFLFGPWILSTLWAMSDPGAAVGLVPGGFGGIEDSDLGLSGGEQANFASMVSTNNIQVTFLAFASGITAGIGTALVLIYNGTFLGAVSGLAFDAGYGRVFMELVVAHGVLELSCIVVTAAAGMRMGAALVRPGAGTRSQALVKEAQIAVAIVLGTAPWLVIAGLVEGFITPAGLGLETVVGLGVSLGLIYWGLVLWRGREAAPRVTDELSP